MSKVNYSNTIYAFDIETTTYNHNVCHYLSSFNSIDFITGELGENKFCRTWLDVNKYLTALNEEFKHRKEVVLVYVHNLGYEFDGLIKNCKFVKDNFDNEKALFIKTRIPLFVRLDYVEFRCSYKFFNNSLKNVGLFIGLEKLEIDYKNQFFDFSKLPPEEYEYNKRDVEIVLKGIYSEKKNWTWIKTANDLPLTSTGLTRKNNKKINDRKSNREIFYYCNYQKSFDEEFISFLEKVFSGGYTHANAFNTGKVLKNVHSFDLISSYPAVMLLKKFPCKFKEFSGQFKLLHLLNIFDYNKKYIKTKGTYEQPFYNYFIFHIKIENVKAKNINNNYILPISLNKCENPLNFAIDNGRILNAESIEIYGTESDLYNIFLFYDFDITECYRLFTTTYVRQLPNFIINSVKSYLYEKSTLKQIIKKIETGNEIVVNDFYNSYKEDFIYTDEKINNLLNDNTELESDLKSLYARSKEKLNAQYGINVQKLLPLNFLYNIDDDTFTAQPETELPFNLTRDFITGLYVTAFARFNLFQLGYEFARNNIDIIYSDTDSWKVLGDLDKINSIVNKYNSLVNSEELYNIGKFDYEETYNYFSTLGCKKYISIKNKIVTTTIAGVGKIMTSDNLNILFKELDYDYNLFYEIAFTPLTIYDYSITGKLICKYNNNYYEMQVEDFNGDSGIITGNNMVELCESDFILMNNYNKLNKNYIYYCEELQNRIIVKEPDLIYKKGDKVLYKYLTTEEFKKLRLYEVKEKFFENHIEH